jgi:hypothetical protein
MQIDQECGGTVERIELALAQSVAATVVVERMEGPAVAEVEA